MLAGGWRQAVQLSVYDLLQRGALLWTDADHARFQAKPSALPADGLERCILERAAEPIDPRHLCDALAAVPGLERADRERLEAAGLAFREVDIANGWRRARLLIALWFVTGATKLILGLIHGKPGIFLFLSLFFAPLLLLLLDGSRSNPRPTRQGERVLELARQRFAADGSSLGRGEPPAAERLMSMAVFGVAALSTVALADGLGRAWAESTHVTGGNSEDWSTEAGGCGSGGGDAYSGDSSDSGDGGGCGGCGGGGD